MRDELTGATAELLQALIRNACVNDGTPGSGEEVRNADLLTAYLQGPGVEIERFEPLPGRTSIVARLAGTDRRAPSLCLMGHTDVVPVNPAGWSRDPFGGELVEGEIWGRGAIDMLNMTAAMAVTFRHLVTGGFRPSGDLVYFAVADEEAGGTWGAEWIAEHRWDAIAADHVLTELGGWSSVAPDGVRHVVVNVGEKGLAWRRIRVRGTPGHGSMPFGSDNALVKAAEVVRRLAAYRPSPQITGMWRAQVAVMDLPDQQRAALVDPARIWDVLGELPVALARSCHAQTHTTFSPNVAHGGQKTNTIPDVVDLDVDIRTLPGTTSDDVDAHLHAALGELAQHIEVSPIHESEATVSSVGNALWDALAERTQVAYPGAQLIPGLVTGGTDARFFRRRGAVAYGAGLFSPSMTFEAFGDRFHGNDERVDVASLGLSTELLLGVTRRLLG